MLPVKGEEPGAFVLTSKKEGKKYVMSEATFKKVIGAIGEDGYNRCFTDEWQVLNEEERRLAEEIREKYFVKQGGG